MRKFRQLEDAECRFPLAFPRTLGAYCFDLSWMARPHNSRQRPHVSRTLAEHVWLPSHPSTDEGTAVQLGILTNTRRISGTDAFALWAHGMRPVHWGWVQALFEAHHRHSPSEKSPSVFAARSRLHDQGEGSLTAQAVWVSY